MPGVAANSTLEADKCESFPKEVLCYYHRDFPAFHTANGWAESHRVTMQHGDHR